MQMIIRDYYEELFKFLDIYSHRRVNQKDTDILNRPVTIRLKQ